MIFGNAVSPILHGGRVIFLHDSQESSSLETIDAATGKTLWKVDRTGFKSGWSTPTIVEREGRKEILVYGVWWLVAYDLTSGAERWRAGCQACGPGGSGAPRGPGGHDVVSGDGGPRPQGPAGPLELVSPGPAAPARPR